VLGDAGGVKSLSLLGSLFVEAAAVVEGQDSNFKTGSILLIIYLCVRLMLDY